MKALTLLLGIFWAFPLYAATSEMVYVVNTVVMLFCAALIMWMAAGFCMLEAGLVRQKSTAVICLKNVLIYSIACLCFYLIGYNLMFTDVGGFMGSFQFLAENRWCRDGGGDDGERHRIREHFSKGIIRTLALSFFK